MIKTVRTTEMKLKQNSFETVLFQQNQMTDDGHLPPQPAALVRKQRIPAMIG